MNTPEQKIIDAIIAKAEANCPESLALIGLYGSFLTGDTHERSDLDLLILINDEKGRLLADGFILDNTKIGYDVYCTTWDMLESDAECHHPHLSKLLDSKLIHVKDQTALIRLEELKNKAQSILSSEVRFERAKKALEEAKTAYAECMLSDSLSEVRTHAGIALHLLLSSIMLYHGRYFKKGVKRTFEELNLLHLPFDIEASCLAVIRSESAEDIRLRLSEIIRNVQKVLSFPCGKESPSESNLRGTYEEMFSNWRNKMSEAAEKNDVYSSFANMVSFQLMLHEVAENVETDHREIMQQFDPNDLEKNLSVFDEALEKYLNEYKKADIHPRIFANVDDYVSDYLK